MLCALIMAGGKGTRFWPLSTEENPKQFLNLVGNESMIQMTVNRLKAIIPMERIFVVTDKKYELLVREHLNDLPIDNIIIEPLGMNTAPCIALSAMLIGKKYPDATLAVLPSDHLIENEKLFQDTLQSANTYIKNYPNSIVTLGIQVTRPEVGYGYIKYKKEYCEVNQNFIHPVEKFVEKPDLNTAKSYLEEGDYLWNSGMFIWGIKNIISLTKKHLPQTYDLLKQIVESPITSYEEQLFKLYPHVQNISVDYGIMEHASEISVIPSNFGWDDIGSWLSLERYRECDGDKNILDGQIKTVDSKRNIIISKTKPMVLCGVEDLILVETDKVIMVMKKDNVSMISEIRQAII